MVDALAFVIHGAPRTKKNSGRIMRPKGLRHPVILPSKPYMAWRGAVLPQLRIIAARLRGHGHTTPIVEDVNCAATFYRDRDIGDAVGYYQALADVLEEAGILENDRQIVSWDGSRLDKDAAQPRVQIVLSSRPVGLAGTRG